MRHDTRRVTRRILHGPSSRLGERSRPLRSSPWFYSVPGGSKVWGEAGRTRGLRESVPGAESRPVREILGRRRGTDSRGLMSGEERGVVYGRVP